MAQCRIAVVGSINVDMTVLAERIPLKGETVYGGDVLYSPGGKGANQAVACARLGAQVEMFGCVGNDENGKRMFHIWKKTVWEHAISKYWRERIQVLH